MTEAERKERCVGVLARNFCQIARIELVDSRDGSPNWWMFVKEAEGVYDGLMARFAQDHTAE
jgi:hypothetical protein